MILDFLKDDECLRLRITLKPQTLKIESEFLKFFSFSQELEIILVVWFKESKSREMIFEILEKRKNEIEILRKKKNNGKKV